MNFSQHHRATFIEKLSTTEFDLIIIGGGITGCGIALDAALRGMKVALVEKSDFASGTSSRSTKLIHGGLRYLKQMEFKLVHDVGSERAIVFRNARHIVIPEKMLLPIVKGGSLGKNSSSLGLLVYDVLAGVKQNERRKILNLSDTLAAEPMLNNNDRVTAGGLYYEYRTDDSRLVIELAKSAHQNDALSLNYAEVKTLLYDENKQVCGVNILDKIEGKEFVIKAKRVVNAAGPFVDLIRKEDQSLYGKRLQLTKGVHIVFPYEKLPLKQAAYFDTPDSRMIFAIPRNGITYVGTTDTVYNQSIDNPHPTKEDAEYLITAVNAMFPTANLSQKDIVSSWAGLRPLIHEDGKSPSELSRKDEIMISPSGLISIAGGKLTGFRLMAEKIVDLVAKQLQTSLPKLKNCETKNYRLSGGEFESAEEVTSFLEKIKSNPLYSIVPDTIKEQWVFRYGKNTETLLQKVIEIQAGDSNFSDKDELYVTAELVYGIQNEMVQTLEDFMIRRTGMIYFDKTRIDKYAEHLLNFLAKDFNWSPQQVDGFKTTATTALKEVATF